MQFNALYSLFPLCLPFQCMCVGLCGFGEYISLKPCEGGERKCEAEERGGIKINGRWEESFHTPP